MTGLKDTMALPGDGGNTLAVNRINSTRPTNFRPQIAGNTTLVNPNVRTLAFKPIDKARSGKGLVDNRLFTGENKLNAIMDEQTTLWHLKQEHGRVDPKLADRHWTSFRMLFNDAVAYYRTRNVEILEEHA